MFRLVREQGPLGGVWYLYNGNQWLACGLPAAEMLWYLDNFKIV